ncbi:MAG: CRISPR system precrRNA processing endoribonuclease RAMP protein Cas6 [Rhodovarius sp.]|nr:CRISPR system precrRNA processing endoribonuclease RAMP protein Cas6 [Rhodovarius sp.]MCX7930938.1 CRISPR system precrRNA processing endoribonuclease RAMP protein Cas6 [Rhodovarius sp.]MDW8314778.1 CRISPR system precrRNA processing endoribonuclease RAMP protein Cas6 [Rhodovarius sp.]
MHSALILQGIRRLDFTFTPRAAVAMQAHSGSAWRGAFGHALKRIVCAMRLRPCTGCPLAGVCIHPAFFGANEAAEGSRPYILCPDRAPPRGILQPGESFRVRLTLLPGAEAAAAYALRALLDAAAAGLTARRIPLDCTAITDAATGEAIDPGCPLPPPADLSCPPAPERVRLRFVTPLRIRLAGDLLTGRSLRPGHLVAAALRRLRLLGFAIPAELAEAARSAAGDLAFREARLGWLETTRFSTRQQSSMQLGGIVGEALLDLRGRPATWPLLWAAGILHLGKGASMGFGRIEAEAA